MSLRERVVLLVGGVGGAKLAVGLANVLPPESLAIIVNTADDFEHLGLHVSPDVDTVMYTLAGIANPETGWGLAGDTFQALDMLGRYGGPDWFRLGDRDLASNLLRTARLREGQRLTAITHALCAALGVSHRILPMTDDPVRTWVETDRGRLAFQEYFVRERWQPAVSQIEFEGAAQARPTPEVVEALEQAALIVFGPSNPFLSLDPILAVPGIRQRIAGSNAPVVAVSPIIGGKAVKGPADKLMAELGYDVSASGIVNYYEDLLSGIILDEVDADLCASIESRGVKAAALPTFMQSLPDKIRLAATLLDWSEEALA